MVFLALSQHPGPVWTPGENEKRLGGRKLELTMTRIIVHYATAVVALTIYGGQV
jgi:hypothetical protein